MPTPPNPYATLVCADGVAETVANIDPGVAARWEAINTVAGEIIPICAEYVRTLGKVGARPCVFKDKCAMRKTDPPVLAPAP